MTMPADRERDRRSLQDLAKMAHGLTPPPARTVPDMPAAPSGVMRATEAKDDDSGIVDLAAASTADPAAAMRAQSTQLASQGLFDDDARSVPPMSAAPQTAPLAAALPAQPAPSLPPLSPSVAPTPSAPAVASASFAPAIASAPHARPEKKKGGGTVIALVIGGVVALSAAAAGGVFFMKSRKAAEQAAAAAAVTTTQPAVIAQAEPPPASNTTPAPEPAAEPTPDPASATPEPAKGKPVVVAKGGAPKIAAAPAAPAPSPAKPEGPAKMTEKDLAAAPSGPAGDLGAAMKKEVGDTPGATPAAASTGATATGNVPQKPSQGAVTGALGAVMPGARACLGPDDPISRASVVFSSGGTVQSVNVSGAAAGKPAEACIKSALMKAKVQPFAEPTYTAPVTIRHQ